MTREKEVNRHTHTPLKEPVLSVLSYHLTEEGMIPFAPAPQGSLCGSCLFSPPGPTLIPLFRAPSTTNQNIYEYYIGKSKETLTPASCWYDPAPVAERGGTAVGEFS